MFQQGVDNFTWTNNKTSSSKMLGKQFSDSDLDTTSIPFSLTSPVNLNMQSKSLSLRSVVF